VRIDACSEGFRALINEIRDENLAQGRLISAADGQISAMASAISTLGSVAASTENLVRDALGAASGAKEEIENAAASIDASIMSVESLASVANSPLQAKILDSKDRIHIAHDPEAAQEFFAEMAAAGEITESFFLGFWQS
jgi:hypothetical protein